MKVWTKARVASVVRDRRTDHNWRSWKKPARQTDETCVAIVNWLSKITPKSFAVDTMSIVEDDVVVDRGSWEMVSLASWCRDPSHISWVFSAFSFKPFCLIQRSSRSIHSTKWAAACWLSTTGALIYILVSSAYECPVSPRDAMMSNNSAV